MAAAVLVPLAISAALTAASMGIQYLTMRKMKQKPVERGRNDDIRIMGSDYGAFIPRVWGKCRFAPQLIYSTGIRVEKIESTQRTSGGGKGGGAQTQKTIDYNYYTTIQLLACKGPVAGITKIWANADLIYSFTPDLNTNYFEAEDGTLSGGASVVADAACSGGNKVQLGSAGHKVQFHLSSPVAPTDAPASTYTLLTVYYKAASAAVLGVAVNGGAPANHDLAATGAAPGTKVIRLTGHPSSVELTYQGSVAVGIDRASTWFSYLSAYPDDIPVTGIEDPIIDFPADPFFPYPKYNYRPAADATGRSSFTATNTANIRIYKGTPTQTQDAAIVADLDRRFGAGQGALRCSAHRGYAYAVLEDHLIPNGNLENFTVEVDQGTTSVPQIVTDLYAEKGIPSPDLDLSAIAGLTRTGLIVNSLTSPNEILGHLQQWYRFRMVEMDGKIKAVLNYSTPVEVITRDDLRAHGDADEAPQADATVTDIPEGDLPETVYVNYLDPSLDGKNNTQQSDLYASTLARDVVNLSFPFTATETEAKTVADHLLLERHTRTRTLEFFTGPKHARKAPGDCVTLDLASGDHAVQIVKEQKTFSGVIKYVAESIDATNVTGNTTTAANVSDILPDAARFAPNTKLFAFESQPVELTHEGLGLYIGVCGVGVGKWNGCGLYHKLTPAEDDNHLATVLGDAGIGTAQSVLGNHTTAAEDTANSLTIYFYNDASLQTVTASELDAKATLNLIRIGNEWVQFRTAVAASLPTGSGYRSAWTISNLRRGLFGTSPQRGTHAASEECCTYDGVRFFALDSRYYGAEAIITAVSVGRSFDFASTATVIVSGKSLEGSAPADLPGRINNPACTIVQNGTATNTAVSVRVTGYSSVQNYRKIEYSSTSGTLASGVTEVIINGLELANHLLPEVQAVTTTSLSAATVKYIAISHSPDGVNWSPRSNIIAVTFADSGGSGGGSGDTPPTFTSVAYDSANSEVDLVFAKNGTATGNIQVEYKLTSDSVWTTHGTEFAHNATSGSIVITEQPTALTYDVRLKQAGVAGYSANTRQVTVDAAPAGGGTPPSNLTASITDSFECEHTVSISWTAGSGSGLYTLEAKVNSGGTWTVLDSNISGTSTTDIRFGSSVSYAVYYRVKQNDVTGYSNEYFLMIPKCIIP